MNPVKAETDKKPEQEESLVIGTGMIMEGNVAEARKAALSEALVKGVEEYLARSMGRMGMMNHFSRLINDVLPHAREDIENFQILAEEQIGNRYKLLVRVRVNEKFMNEKLQEMGLLSVEGPPIRVLFLVSQIESPKGQITCWWTNPTDGSDLTPTELALYRVFQERGLQPINRLTNLPNVAFPEEIKETDLSDEGAL
jgi:hypothetical protein